MALIKRKETAKAILGKKSTHAVVTAPKKNYHEVNKQECNDVSKQACQSVLSIGWSVPSSLQRHGGT